MPRQIYPRKKTRSDKGRRTDRYTLPVAIAVLREVARPMRVREIIEAAGERLLTRSQQPRNVVARDIALAIKHHGDASPIVRLDEGLYALREQLPHLQTTQAPAA